MSDEKVYYLSSKAIPRFDRLKAYSWVEMRDHVVKHHLKPPIPIWKKVREGHPLINHQGVADLGHEFSVDPRDIAMIDELRSSIKEIEVRMALSANPPEKSKVNLDVVVIHGYEDPLAGRSV